jgi:hypothetical protein
MSAANGNCSHLVATYNTLELLPVSTWELCKLKERKTFSQNLLSYNIYWVTDWYGYRVVVLRNKDYYTNAIFWRTAKDVLCLLIMYFSRYCRLTGAATENFSINEQIPRTGFLSVQYYLRAAELLVELHQFLLLRTNPKTTLALQQTRISRLFWRSSWCIFGPAEFYRTSSKKVHYHFIRKHNESAACLVLCLRNAQMFNSFCADFLYRM